MTEVWKNINLRKIEHAHRVRYYSGYVQPGSHLPRLWRVVQSEPYFWGKSEKFSMGMTVRDREIARQKHAFTVHSLSYIYVVPGTSYIPRRSNMSCIFFTFSAPNTLLIFLVVAGWSQAFSTYIGGNVAEWERPCDGSEVASVPIYSSEESGEYIQPLSLRAVNVSLGEARDSSHLFKDQVRKIYSLHAGYDGENL